MDPLSVLRALLALGVFPGALLLAVCTGLAAAIAGIPRGRRATLEDVVAIAAAVAASGVAPLPGSPLNDLPAGIALPSILLFVAVSVVWGTTSAWPRGRVIVAASVVTAVLCLALPATTLSATTVAGYPGRVETVARVLVAIAILAALPLVAEPFVATSSRWSRAAVTASILVLASSLVTAGEGGATPAVLAVGAVLGGVVGYSLLLRLVRGIVGARPAGLAVVATGPALAAIVVLVIGGS